MQYIVHASFTNAVQRMHESGVHQLTYKRKGMQVSGFPFKTPFLDILCMNLSRGKKMPFLILLQARKQKCPEIQNSVKFVQETQP